MVIKTKLTKEDFINVNFVLLFSKLPIRFFAAFMMLWLLMATVVSVASPYGSPAYVIVPVLMLIFIPLMTYVGAVKNYKGNNRINETIEYHFEDDNLSMKGESFNSQLSWDKIYKVTQVKNWLLIWQSRQVANPISKRNISEEQIGELRQILKNHNVKNNL